MKTRRITAIVLAFMLCMGMLPAGAFAAQNISNVEWANFRNSDENNGVTDRETPVTTEEATLKWAAPVAKGYTQSCTPPLILDGYAYTAQGRYIYKLDKETGKQMAQSVKLAGQLGYALNPILYANGMLFVQINNGRIQALDAKTLESLWISEEVGGQTLSPVTYKNGYIYTGTWNAEDKDGTYYCLSVRDEKPDQPDEVKKCTWKFVPSQKGETPRGFYWAGSYVSENYVAFGSDDGVIEGRDAKTGSFYTVDPKSGEIIDKLDGLNGDVRTTTVYSGGYLYFATKGGSLYKVSVDKDGNLGTSSSIELKGMMTASPVVYNGRIYIGICGLGDLFSADGGHKFAVINDDAELSASSLAYEVPIKGYPQAAALLSTAAKAQNGKVYLYFTYNTKPGGIYYLADAPGQTSGSAKLLFTPPKEMQQHCISTLCCDKEGTLYYKNDSGYLMAVAKNRAYLNDITASAASGKITWSDDFNPGYTQYDLIAEAGTKEVKLTLSMPQGVQATVDGKACGGTFTCDLGTEGRKTVSIQVSKTEGSKTYERTYTLSIRQKGNSAVLSDLKISASNAFGAEELPLDKAFSPESGAYTAYMEGRANKFVNIWPLASEAKAKIQIYPLENVTSKGVDEDGTIGITAASGERDRYAVYLTEGKTTAKIRIRVTSEDGALTKDYLVTINRGSAASQPTDPVDPTNPSDPTDPSQPVEKPVLTISKASLTLYTCKNYNKASLTASLNGKKTTSAAWKVTKGSGIVSVSKTGVITAKKAGSAAVTVSAQGVSKTCRVTVKKANFQLAKSALTLKKNKTAAIKVKQAVPKGTVTYKSANKKIASVTSKGVVKGKKKGKTYVKVTCNGISKKVKITVK